MYRSSPIIRWRRFRDRYLLEGNQCSECKEKFYPKKFVCSKCSSRKLNPLVLKGKGKLLSFTEIITPPDIFIEKAPYCIGIIKLEEGPSITSQLSDCTLKDLKIGMQMEASFKKFYESGKKGAIHYGTKFVPS